MCLITGRFIQLLMRDVLLKFNGFHKFVKMHFLCFHFSVHLRNIFQAELKTTNRFELFSVSLCKLLIKTQTRSVAAGKIRTKTFYRKIVKRKNLIKE